MKKTLLIPTLIIAGMGLGACKGSAQYEPFDPCTIQPTRLSTPQDEGYPDAYVEWDGETIDSDPCDSDDFVVDSKGRVTKNKKPTFVQPTSAATKPAPKVTMKPGTTTTRKR